MESMIKVTDDMIEIHCKDEIEYLIMLRNDAVDYWPAHRLEWLGSELDYSGIPLYSLTMLYIHECIHETVKGFIQGQWNDGTCVNCGRWGSRCICLDNCMCHVPNYYCHHHMR